MLGQTHVNGWSRVIASQNGGSTSYIFSFRLRILQWSLHLFNYWDINKKTKIEKFLILLIFNLLKDLVHKLLKHQVNYLCISPWWLVSKFSTRLTVIIPLWSRISLFKGEDFGFSFSLSLVFLDLLMLINAVHELTYTSGGFQSQRFSQVVFCWEPNLKGSYGYIFKIPIYFIKCFLILVRVGFQSLPFPHHHG